MGYRLLICGEVILGVPLLTQSREGQCTQAEAMCVPAWLNVPLLSPYRSRQQKKRQHRKISPNITHTVTALGLHANIAAYSNKTFYCIADECIQITQQIQFQICLVVLSM